jgi:hypothetical protein
LQKIAKQEVDNIEKELLKLRSQCPLISTVTYDTLSLAELDKKRAIAIASKESWVARSSKKSLEITERVNEIIQDITDAEKVLEMQKQHIHELHQMHKDNWDIRQDVILRSHNAKVSELQDACQSKGQFDSHSTASVIALQAQVSQLLAQLATLGVQPIVVEQTAPLFIASPVSQLPTNDAKDVILTDQPGVEPFVVPAMSIDEQAARIALRAAKGNDASQGLVDNIPIVSTNALAKGKGKGKPDNGGVY